MQFFRARLCFIKLKVKLHFSVDQYLSAANSCCVNGGGGNTELAFHALAKAGGSVKLAMKQLLARKQRVFFNDPLENYHYQSMSRRSPFTIHFFHKKVQFNLKKRC